MESVKNNYFFCYDFRLKLLLVKNNFRFILTAKTHSNDKTFWLFERSTELNDFLNEIL